MMAVVRTSIRREMSYNKDGIDHAWHVAAVRVVMPVQRNTRKRTRLIMLTRSPMTFMMLMTMMTVAVVILTTMTTLTSMSIARTETPVMHDSQDGDQARSEHEHDVDEYCYKLRWWHTIMQITLPSTVMVLMLIIMLILFLYDDDEEEEKTEQGQKKEDGNDSNNIHNEHIGTQGNAHDVFHNVMCLL